MRDATMPLEATTTLDLESFFRAEYRSLCQALVLLVGDAFEAEEIAQETMTRVLERWDRVSTMDSPTGYTYRTALNLQRKRIRRLAVRAKRRFASVPTGDVAADAGERHDVRRALASLPDAQRVALVLVDWLDMDHEEAARTLGITTGNLRVRARPRPAGPEAAQPSRGGRDPRHRDLRARGARDRPPHQLGARARRPPTEPASQRRLGRLHGRPSSRHGSARAGLVARSAREDLRGSARWLGSTPHRRGGGLAGMPRVLARWVDARLQRGRGRPEVRRRRRVCRRRVAGPDDPDTGLDIAIVRSSCPVWSPDGRRIATVAPGRGVLIAGLDGERELVRFDAYGLREGGDLDLAWSPDGSQLAFLVSPTKSTQVVRIISADGGSTHVLTGLLPDGETPGMSVNDIAWTSDGGSVVVAGGPCCAEGGLFLRVIDVATGDGYEVPLPEAMQGYGLQMLPTGDDRFILMWDWQQDPVMLDLEGNVTTIHLEHPPTSYLRLSPDGKQLLYVTFDQPPTPDPDCIGQYLVAVPIAGGKATRYSPCSDPGFGDNYSVFSWQPIPRD